MPANRRPRYHFSRADRGAAQACPPSAAPPDRGEADHEIALCSACLSSDEHDDWNAQARGETPLQRADRAYGEILQEVRVAQTGVQILFAFLLTLAFTNRFAAITEFQRYIYVLTLMLSAAAAALLIAPAAFHRVVYRRRLKQHLVHAASRLALAGLVLLLLAMVSALLLILDVVTGRGPAMVLAASAMGWFIAWWFVLPTWQRVRHEGHQYLTAGAGTRRRGELAAAGPGGGPALSDAPGDESETGSSPLASTAPFTGPDAAGVNSLTAE
jgi:uncharacterized protein DUF6328